MFPMEFDHRLLEGVPLLDDEGKKRVFHILHILMAHRVLPHFRSSRGTDPTLINRIGDRITIGRLEDESNRIRAVSLVFAQDDRWLIQIHERIFDYLAFAIPADPESRIGGAGVEESKMLAFAELVLRHEVEHALYPDRSERDVTGADVLFAMDRRENDPTFYRALRNALGDEMTGIRGESYLALLDAAEQGRAYEYLITRILTSHVTVLADMPRDRLERAFPLLDDELKTKVLGEYHRRSRDTSLSLKRRSRCLQGVLALFALALQKNEASAEKVFESFKDRWGVIDLFRELGIPEISLERKDAGELFSLLKENLGGPAGEGEAERTAVAGTEKSQAPASEALQPPPKTKSLKERIEEARNDPLFPRQALEVIDKNRVSAVGHSGPKYTELIETLLAIPWGRMQEIRVSPEAFEQGLDKSHYGLERPKAMVCDFFTNLIWQHQELAKAQDKTLRGSGSSFLFVGPPGVGKTSLAISIARNLGVPYHKISLGGMRDEADLRGYGFTYEGSKPGAVVQGLIKMGVMNGMFIMDEADKTEAFAISTLLEILDPEQNHLFHDKFVMTTVDVDLSNCHFILTANTLDTVPPPVINRCEVVLLDRYSVEEKIAIGREHLIRRVRERYHIQEGDVRFIETQEKELLRFLVKTYTHEPGVRELERIIRTLFLRIMRKEILTGRKRSVVVNREKIKAYLEPPSRPPTINEESRVGEVMALGVDVARGLGSVIPVQATAIRFGTEGAAWGEGYLSMVHATGNIQRIMDESRKVAFTGILHCAGELGISLNDTATPIHLHFMGASTPKDGPSAGGAIALALASALSGRPIRRDVAMTGEIDTQGRIKEVGGVDVKLETACDAGCKTLIIPRDNLKGRGGIGRLPEALKAEIQILDYEAWAGDHSPFDYERHVIQVVGVENIVQAARIAFIDSTELEDLEERFASYGRTAAGALQEEAVALSPSALVIYAKDPEELSFFKADQDAGSVLLLCPRNGKAGPNAFSGVENVARLRPFNHSSESLEDVIADLLEGRTNETEPRPVRVSVAAPFFFLKQDGIRPEAFPEAPGFEGIRIFANNFTVQSVKIKSCKAALNRMAFYLGRLDPAHTESCPFLVKKRGVYCVDLSLIPEKYRLDVKQAEEVLNRCLNRWLREAAGTGEAA